MKQIFREAAAISGSRAGVVDRCDAVGMWRRWVGDGSVYCPPDRKLYLDLSFFRELDERSGAPGDFAQAYDVAHEVGHHVQTLTGDRSCAAAREQGGRRRQMRCRFVRSSRRTAMRAWGALRGAKWAVTGRRRRRRAARGGRDRRRRLQKQGQGRVAPNRSTHGSSEQRVMWFDGGLTGSRRECDTFGRGTESDSPTTNAA